MAGRDWSNIVYSDAYLLASWSSFKSYQQISEPRRNRWFAFVTVPRETSAKQQAPISYAIYRWRGNSFLGVYLRHAISAHPFRCRLHNSPSSPSPPLLPFCRRSVLLDAILLMCCTSPVIPSQFVTIFNLVNRRTYDVFMHLCQFRIQITLSIHVVFPLYLLLILLHTCFVSSSRHSSVSTQLQQMRGGQSHSRVRWKTPSYYVSLLSITM